MTTPTRTIAWTKPDPAGAELAEITLHANRMEAHGVAIGGAPGAYRLDYGLQTVEDFVTAWLSATARGDGGTRSLRLIRGADGEWTANRTETGTPPFEPIDDAVLGSLAGAADCDLMQSGVTNTMPVLRHGLLSGGGPVDVLVAWVSVPDLAVFASWQRYTFVRAIEGGGVVLRFETPDDGFSAEVTFDADGVAVAYPGIARRLG